MSNSLAKLEQADRMLAEATDLEDIAQIRDIATAARAYAKAAQLGIEATNKAALIKIKAERKAGEYLKQLERGSYDRGNQYVAKSHDVTQPSEYAQALDDVQINKMTAHRWQKMANVPDEVFVEHVEQVTGAGEELTSASVMRLAAQVERQKVAEQRQDAPPLPDEKYRIVYADPPWKYGNSGVIGETDNYGHVARHYPDMSINELCELPIRDMVEDNAVLFMWVTSPLLEECFPVIKAWGFKYKTSFVWDKVGHNFGHYNSVRHEFLLVCTRGSCTPDNLKLFDSVQSIEKTKKHSEKPEEFRAIIDTLYTWGKRIELFSRTTAEGWDAWGNE